MHETRNVDSTPPLPKSRDAVAVRAMFDRIASRYDLANHWLSAGADFWWRARAIHMVAKWQPKRLLDLATGSGDLALKLQRRLPNAEVTATDFSPEMLAIAKWKGVRTTVLADALQLPFRDASFDCVTVAFGLRNMSDWSGALREMRRVLCAGGHLLVLDFSKPIGALQPAYDFYLHHILPTAAGWITGNRNAYEYLASSIDSFPSGTAMTEMFAQNGFYRCCAHPLTGGIVTIYTGEVPG